MKPTSTPVKHPDLKGAEQHHPLKNQPGEKGKKEHADSDETLDRKSAKQVEKSTEETQIADQLRTLTPD